MNHVVGKPVVAEARQERDRGEDQPALCFELASESQALPVLVDWDQLMDIGVQPALILGAERRLRR